MCGFIGIFSPKGLSPDKLKLEKLTNLIHHRGPNENGYFIDDKINLGFKRLSIIDLKNGKQPFESQNKRYVLAYNGEIYNYKYLRKILISKNIKLKTNSDTEVLVESISNFGLDYINKMNGMFAFVLYDKKENCAYFFRDRLGIKPLFFYYDGSQIAFSSEIKALINTNLFKKEINFDAISSYLSFRFNYGVGNFFKNIQTLEAGHYIKISTKGIEKNNYWKYPFNSEKFNLNEDKLVEKCTEIINNVTSEHLVSDVPVGSLLSGGLDSSLLTSIMNINQTEKINTFSASFEETDYDENRFAQIISKKINSNHFNIILNSQDYQKHLNDIIIHSATPLSIPHEIALNCLFKEIKQHTKVVISGEGADEMFGGYGRVQSSGFDYKKINFVKKFLPKKIQIFFLNLMGSNKDFQWHKYSNQLDHFFDIYKWFGLNEKFDLFTNDVKLEIKKDEKLISFWKLEFEKLKNVDELEKILFIFQKHHLQCLLHRLDLHSMSHSVEARVPFCDHRIIEFMNKVPYRYKFKWKSMMHNVCGLFNNSFNNSENKDISKYLLRKLSLKYLPKEISNKKKLGFPVPLDNWLTGSFLNYSKEILLDKTALNRGIFDSKQIENLLFNKENIKYDFWGKKIWMLINIELWARNFIDGN